MKLIEINWDPSDRQLRQFALICLVALPLVGWLWGAGATVLTVLVSVGVLLAISGMVLPRVIKPVFMALTLVATPIGMVIGEIAMMLIFFGVFLPMGLLFRVIKRDALQLTVDREAPTYWQPKRKPTSVASYYRQS